MGKEDNFILIDQLFKEIFWMVNSMGKENNLMLMDQVIREIFWMVNIRATNVEFFDKTISN